MACETRTLQHTRVIKRRRLPSTRGVAGIASIRCGQVGGRLADRLAAIVAGNTGAQHFSVVDTHDGAPGDRAMAARTGIRCPRMGGRLASCRDAIVTGHALATQRLGVIKATVFPYRRHGQSSHRRQAGTVTIRALTTDDAAQESAALAAAWVHARAIGRHRLSWPRCRLVFRRDAVFVAARRAVGSTGRANGRIRGGRRSWWTTDVMFGAVTHPIDGDAIEHVTHAKFMTCIAGVTSRRRAHIADRHVTHDRAGERGGGLMAARTLHWHLAVGDRDVHASGRHLHDLEPRRTGKRTLAVGMARTARRRDGAVQSGHVVRVEGVVTGRRVADGAGRPLIDRDVIGGQRGT